MSREPHGPVRRLSMLIVAVPCLLIGGSLLYHFLPEELARIEYTDGFGRTHYDFDYRYHSWRTPAGVGTALSFVGVGFVVTALTPTARGPRRRRTPGASTRIARATGGS